MWWRDWLWQWVLAVLALSDTEGSGLDRSIFIDPNG